ncbi:MULTISPECIES: cobalt-precorrin-6A reductase [Pseudomonas]|uniref:Cobalt-precorrin-6A reductase n=1 Tax=Pseudomonas quercus TaxID=2722792 RepID=A0ABX0YB64_9PSED|nr:MULTISPECIES: cobalt-precorrin-6A reductase [Pseudomonas]MBF7142022.1 cobalt-precorrin-6A reductase [Pseudomonas sp. LY10J]NJP00560.1 cobalt-precorrin-6A reductase [Pseudomonas quercus]
MRILLLGGVTESLRIARELGPEHIYSLAGIGRIPTDLRCTVKVGGYGGAEGLADYIRAEGVTLLVDATHPYAAQMSHNAVQAAGHAGIPCWALRRPGWHPQPGDDWRNVTGWASLSQAISAFERPFFTLGREPLAHLSDIPAHQYWTLRCLDDHPGNDHCTVIGARGPFQLEQERALFAQGRFDVLISKNSGSGATEPKLQVARERGIPVVMLARPVLPAVDRAFERVEEMIEALHGLMS